MKGKGTWGKVKRKPGRSFLELLSLESHRTCSLPPAITGDNTFEMLSTREACYRLRVSSGAGYIAPLADPGPGCRHSGKGKAGVQHKPHFIQTVQAQ